MLFLCLVVFCLFYPDEMLWGFLKSDEGVFFEEYLVLVLETIVPSCDR